MPYEFVRRLQSINILYYTTFDRSTIREDPRKIDMKLTASMVCARSGSLIVASNSIGVVGDMSAIYDMLAICQDLKAPKSHRHLMLQRRVPSTIN